MKFHIKFLLFICSWGPLLSANAYNPSVPFFIYDWPAELQSSRPKPGTILKRSKWVVEDYAHDFQENNGFGRSINPDAGLYATIEFDGYSPIMARLRTHALRTYDRHVAKIFIVPYDLCPEAMWGPHGEYLNHQVGGCPRAEKVNALLTEELKSSPLWGHDHVMIASCMIVNPKCNAVIETCSNCTVLQPLAVPGWRDSYHLRMTYNNTARRWHSILPMSSFHYHTNIKQLPWVRQHPATYLATLWSTAGATQRKFSNEYRKMLMAACVADKRCYAVPIGRRGQRQCLTTTDINCTRNPKHTGVLTGMEAYNSSTFCIQPPGDNFIRKGILDSMLTGCIPVMVQHPHQRHVMKESYPLFFPGDLAERLFIFLDGGNSSNVMEFLSSISAAEISARTQEIAKYGMNLQYSIPPPDLVGKCIGHAGGPGVATGCVWSPPVPDAVDLLLVGLSTIINRFEKSHVLGEMDKSAWGCGKKNCCCSQTIRQIYYHSEDWRTQLL